MLRPLLRRLTDLYARTGRWPGRLLRRLLAAGPRRPAGRPARLWLEPLEERALPSVNFATHVDIPASGEASAITMADVNGDGRPDLIGLLDGTNHDMLAVSLNTTGKGASTPSFAARVDFPGGSGFSVAAADVNGDGKPDLITANGYNAISVLLNTTVTGTTIPSFAPKQDFAALYRPAKVIAADVNGDGKPDLIVADNVSNSVSVLLNMTATGAATPSFAAHQDFAAGSWTLSVAAADVNGDSCPDLIALNANDNSVSVLLNTTPRGGAVASFAARQDFPVGSNPVDVAAVDLNGDGRPDVFTLNEGANSISVLLNTTPPGAAAPAFAARQDFAVGVNGFSLTAADIDGDGRPDLISPDGNDKTVSVLVNTTPSGASSPSFAARRTFATGDLPYGGVVVADVNGDSKPDVLASVFYGSVAVFLNTSSGPTSPTQSTVIFFNSPAAADSFTTVRLVTRNAAGAAETAGDDVVTFGLGNSSGARGYFGPVTDNGDGTYDATFRATGAGPGTLIATVNGAAVAGVPFNVTPGPADPLTSVVTIARGAVAVGGTTTVTLRARDSYGNDETSGGETVTFSTSGSGQGIFFPTSDNHNGTYTATFTATAAGTVTVVGQINGNPVYPPGPSLLIAAKSAYDTADFAGAGVWQYAQASSTWTQLSPTDAAAFAANASGRVAAAFRGQGVWTHAPGGAWARLSPTDATALGIDDLGNVTAEFPGQGVWRYTTSWAQLSPSDAALLSEDAAGRVVADFRGAGVWLYAPGSGWAQLTGGEASLLAINGGVVVGDFSGAGVWRYQAGVGWKQLSATDATAVAVDAGGDAAASFGGAGLYAYTDAGGWVSLGGAAGPLAMDAAGDVVADFGAAGLWRYEQGSWKRLSPGHAYLLAVGG
jgi:hypothetical protein